MLRKLRIALAFAASTLLATPSLAADIVLSTGTQFQNGFRLVDGADLNKVLDRVNDLSDGTWTFTGPLLPATTNTYALGSASATWSDLFLGSGAVINFDAGDVTITAAANALTFAGGAYTLTGNTTVTGTLGITGATTGTSASASALAVGLTGATNPAFVVDASTASQAAGLKVTGAVAAGTVAVATISSGADANLTVNAKGTGTIGIGSVSTGAVTITPATTVTGAITPTGGVAASGGFSVSGRNFNTCGIGPTQTTDGTNLDIVTTETYRAEIFVPANFSSTGVAIFNGTAVAGNLQAYLIDSAGAQVTGVLTASTAQSGTVAYQRIAWAGGPYTIKGPATYWIAVQGNNSGGDLRTQILANCGADKQTGTTFGTLTVAASPTTFTTGLGPIASLY